MTRSRPHRPQKDYAAWQHIISRTSNDRLANAKPIASFAAVPPECFFNLSLQSGTPHDHMRPSQSRHPPTVHGATEQSKSQIPSSLKEQAPKLLMQHPGERPNLSFNDDLGGVRPNDFEMCELERARIDCVETCLERRRAEANVSTAVLSARTIQ